MTQREPTWARKSKKSIGNIGDIQKGRRRPPYRGEKLNPKEKGTPGEPRRQKIGNSETQTSDVTVERKGVSRRNTEG